MIAQLLDSRYRRTVDWALFAITAVLCALGIVFIFSATRGLPGEAWKKQLLAIVLGCFALVAAMRVDFHRYTRYCTRLYVATLILLIIVLKAAPATNGAARWIRIGGFPFQPSEFAKLVVIYGLAVFLKNRQEEIGELRTVLLSLAWVAVPMALIFKQPDLGTALVIFAIWLGMVFMAGGRLRHIGGLLAIGAVLFVGLWFSGRVLKHYQKNRLIAFVNPEAEPKEAGYHILQARIAIGSGQMWGQGYLKGTEVHGGYIPERQSDFIFTDIGEEWGFVGALAVIGLYVALLWRGALVVAAASQDFLGQMIATGIVTMLAVHVLVNIGMNVGIMPVTGVPLPLISVGGSNVVSTLIAVGLLQSVGIRHHRLLF
ncbi:MAG: rod shape-determining protein RodA [Armatimonadetes bacterium]|nr:rod shape-determining protein RodA [Armatimonadota bacterium]MDE2205201.1 rod shape-determining protein RodA [Armatimonadota bacterium]